MSDPGAASVGDDARARVALLGLVRWVVLLSCSACSDSPHHIVVVPPETGQFEASSPGTDRSDGSDGMVPPGASTSTGCGNNIVEMDEECDDGNRRDGDGCSSRCKLQSCGDGSRDRYEECDDGNREGGDGCDPFCQREVTPAACGDGTIDSDSGEACDDGNLIGGDGCGERCELEVCGDGVLAAGEDCDPPDSGLCGFDCRLVLPNCGDGVLQEEEGEGCDDGNGESGDGCDRCQVECGDGRVDPSIGEQCEPPGSTFGRPCDARCRWLPKCGDGIFQPEVEACDGSSPWPGPDGFECIICELQPIAAVPEPGPDTSTQDAGTGMTVCQVDGPSAIPTPGFGSPSDADAWIAVGRMSTGHAPDVGLQAPGALRMDFAPLLVGSDLEVSAASRCVAVEPGHDYDFKAFVRLDPGTPVTAYAYLRATGFATPDCTGQGQGSLTTASSVMPQTTGWLAYQTVVSGAPAFRTVKLELALSKPRDVHATAYWDDLEMVSKQVDAACGNCVVDGDRGETCDDGNRLPGDGCDGTCQEEACGDGRRGGGEQCDDGARLWSDSPTCTSTCRLKANLPSSGACDDCIAQRCADDVLATLDRPGVASGGPRAGTPYAELALELRECVHRTGCSGPTLAAAQSAYSPPGGALENCYCGTALDEGCYLQGAADGLCKREVEAVVETTQASEVWRRLGATSDTTAGTSLPSAMGRLLWCEGHLASGGGNDALCPSSCSGTVSSACGDGWVQDRLATDARGLCAQLLPADQPCDLFLEECDDGNLDDGDGCDSRCFVEACGNGIVQSGEECDDGNRLDGDGCDGQCIAEFRCGDGVVTAPFETCDRATGDNPTRICTPAEFSADPDQCRCDPQTCQAVVCGDGVVGDGEGCEPPGQGGCDATCQPDEHPCATCSRAITPNPAEGRSCAPELYLDGRRPASAPPTFQVPPHLQGGCLSDPTCFALLTCLIESQCVLGVAAEPGLAAGDGACICGDTPVAECFAAAMPTGPCAPQAVAAFEAQLGGPPVDGRDLTERLSASPEEALGFASMWTPFEYLARCVGSEAAPLVGGFVTDSAQEAACPDLASCPQEALDAAQQAGQMCEAACFP